jgi:hypothetical protein
VHLDHGKFAIGTVRNYRLARLKTQLRAVELYRNYVRFEGHQAGNAVDLRKSHAIRPCPQTCITDVVVVAQPFVWAEGLMFHEGQRGLIDVGTRNISARRKAGLVEDKRPLSIGDDATTMANHEVA